MKAWVNSRQTYIRPQRWAFTTLAVTALMLGAMIFPFVPGLKASEPLTLNYRTINAVEPSELPGVTVFTLEIEVRNTDKITYHNISVTATSLTDPTSSYGTVAVGDLGAGASRSVTGEFRVPTSAIENMTFRIIHSS